MGKGTKGGVDVCYEVRGVGVRKVVLVREGGIYKGGVGKGVIECLEEGGMEVVVFKKVEGNGRVGVVKEG
ncbi:iron-containing alcohol dehydrogenase [Bacillus velezensis]|uniref:iron-containing alcohol dehydrogenase n=1 Tax=Bacillus velezensis TaxID=492670 RepID=UPI0011A8D4C6|nr:iron-containing alcohol dehydrogenase [Bacillus velezensis]